MQMPCFNRNQPLPQMCLCKPFLSLHELLPPESTLPGHMSPGTWQRKIPYKWSLTGKNITFFNGGCSMATLDYRGNFNYFPVVFVLFFSCLKLIPNILLLRETMLFWRHRHHHHHHHHHHIVVHLFLTRYLSSASRISITFTCCKIQRLPGECFFFDLMFLHVFG